MLGGKKKKTKLESLESKLSDLKIREAELEDKIARVEKRVDYLEALELRLKPLEREAALRKKEQEELQGSVKDAFKKVETVVMELKKSFKRLEKGELAMQIDSLLKWQESQEAALNAQETDFRKALRGQNAWLEAQSSGLTKRLNAFEDIVQDRLSEVSQELKPIAMKSSEIAQVKLLLDSLTERLTAFEKELNVGSK